MLIIEPRQLFHECLSHRLSHSPGIEVVSVTNSQEWPKLAADHSNPDVVLLCVADGEPLPSDRSELPPGMEGLCSVPLVVLSNERPPSDMYDLLKSGVRGFLPTNFSCSMAIQVLRFVKAGGTFVPASCLSSLPNQRSNGVERGSLFTGRQKQVIEAIRQGKPNKVIAYELSMCESTVKVHVRRIMKKLKASNRTQVAYLYSSPPENETPQITTNDLNHSELFLTDRGQSQPRNRTQSGPESD